jgi:hypothetical protein
LAIYKAQADDLLAGRTPRVKSDGLTVADLCNRFRTAKLRQRDHHLRRRQKGDTNPPPSRRQEKRRVIGADDL